VESNPPLTNTTASLPVIALVLLVWWGGLFLSVGGCWEIKVFRHG
jgi:hypothetical protein